MKNNYNNSNSNSQENQNPTDFTITPYLIVAPHNGNAANQHTQIGQLTITNGSTVEVEQILTGSDGLKVKIDQGSSLKFHNNSGNTLFITGPSEFTLINEQNGQQQVIGDAAHPEA